MFKKDIKISNRTQLAIKDKKTLKKDLEKFFNPVAVENLLNSNDVIYCDKAGSKQLVFQNETFPLFVDVTGKGDYIPSIYVLCLYPDICNYIEVNTGIEDFFLKGANLMWAGVKQDIDYGQFEQDDVRYVRTNDGKIIGVGAMACSSKDLKKNGPTGPALLPLHILGDKLWELGNQIAPEQAQSQIKDVKIKKEEKQEVTELKEETKNQKESKGDEDAKKKKKKKKAESEEEEEDQNDVDDLAAYMGITTKKAGGVSGGGAPARKKPEAKPVATKTKEVVFSDEEDNKKKGKKKGKAATTKKKDKNEEGESDEENPKNKKTNKKENKKGKDESDDEEEDDDEEEQTEKTKQETTTGGGIPTHVVDEYLKEAFLTALKLKLNDKDLPLESNAFFKDYVLACKRQGVSVDIKQSSYQKVGKFLAAMQKQGFIEYKEAKKNTPSQITKIIRANKELKEFEPVILKTNKEEDFEETKESDNQWPKVDIVELSKPKDHIKFAFAKENKEQKEYYTLNEAKEIIQDYIKPHLQKKNVKFNADLLQAFPQVKYQKEAEEEEEEQQQEKQETEYKQEKESEETDKKKEKTIELSKEETIKLFEEALETYHKIINLQTKKEEIKKGPFKGIHIIAEKQHNKNVTKITGLEQFGFDLQKLTPKLQAKFSTPVQAHDLPGKGAGKELTLNGSIITELTDYLQLDFKIEPNYITSQNKLEKKKQKGGYQV